MAISYVASDNLRDSNNAKHRNEPVLVNVAYSLNKKLFLLLLAFMPFGNVQVVERRHM